MLDYYCTYLCHTKYLMKNKLVYNTFSNTIIVFEVFNNFKFFFNIFCFIYSYSKVTIVYYIENVVIGKNPYKTCVKMKICFTGGPELPRVKFLSVCQVVTFPKTMFIF